MKKVLAPLAAVVLFAAAPTNAYESVEIQNPTGRPVFDVRFYGPSDGEWYPGRDPSTWAWKPNIQQQVVQGMGYWADVLQLPEGQGPAVLNVGTVDMDGNAFGGSPIGEYGADSRTLFQRHFQGLPVD